MEFDVYLKQNLFLKELNTKLNTKMYPKNVVRGRNICMLHPFTPTTRILFPFSQKLIQKQLLQARFFLASADLFPKAEPVLEEFDSKPLRVAKIPKHMKGKYIVKSFSEAFFDPVNSDNTATCIP